MRAAFLLVVAPLCVVGCGSDGDPASPVDDGGLEAAADGASDAPPGDAGSDATPDADSGDGDGGAGPAGPTRYPHDARHSPMAPAVVARVKAIVDASPHRKGVFAKVGASNTVNGNFFHCFAGTDVKLGAHAALEPTRAFFRETLADATRTSFDRTSLAATVGWGAGKTIAGEPSPIEQEVAAIDPAFAVVLLGTNDTYASGVHPFERNMRGVVDALLGLSVVPIVTTIPPRSDTAEAAALVPEMNAILRAVAQARQVPFVDLYSELLPLPDLGLVGDGIHLSVHVSGGARGCWLTPEALDEGMNVRNLVTLEALDRVKRFVLDGAPPEAAPPPLAGAGTWVAPYAIDALPFVDDRSTATSSADEVDVYPCGPQDESGPEVVYRIDLAEPAKLRVRVFADDGADVDLHWLDGETAATCTARHDRVLDVDASAGAHRLVIDTFVASAAPKPGGYRLTIVPR